MNMQFGFHEVDVACSTLLLLQVLFRKYWTLAVKDILFFFHFNAAVDHVKKKTFI